MRRWFDMLFFIAFVGAAIIALVLWKAMNSRGAEFGQQHRRRPVAGPSRPPVGGPDDDPDFLRQLDEKVRKRDDPPRG